MEELREAGGLDAMVGERSRPWSSFFNSEQAIVKWPLVTRLLGEGLFEPPGETHTLVVPNDVQEMITLFHITGCMIYVDPWGKQTGYEDVFTKITMCRQHYGENGLGAKFVEQFIH